MEWANRPWFAADGSAKRARGGSDTFKISGLLRTWAVCFQGGSGLQLGGGLRLRVRVRERGRSLIDPNDNPYIAGPELSKK